MMYTLEDKKIIPVLKPGDYAGSGNGAGINVTGAHHVTFIISGAAQTDGDAQVTVETGTAHDTMDGVITPKVYRTTAAAGAVGADATQAVAYEAGENYWKILITDDLTYIVEVPVALVPEDKKWMRLKIGDQGGGTNLSAVAIVYPRYKPSGTLVRTA